MERYSFPRWTKSFGFERQRRARPQSDMKTKPYNRNSPQIKTMLRKYFAPLALGLLLASMGGMAWAQTTNAPAAAPAAAPDNTPKPDAQGYNTGQASDVAN